MKKVFTLLSLIFLITTSFAAIKKGPYLIFPGVNTQMTVLWQLSTTETATIEWGTDLTYSAGSAQTVEYGNDHQHKFTINNLIPGTKYHYKVSIASGSYTGTFNSAPENQDVGNLKFLAYGDTRSYPSTQNKVTGSMINLIELDPAYQTLCLLSGDYISTDGEANWGDHYFGRNYANNVEFLENIPVMGAIGNHEGSGTYFKKYYPYPHVNSFYYSFDYGPLHVVCVDQFRASYSPGSAQYNWIENDLASTTKEWKVIVLHAPGWSAGGGHSNNTSVQNYLQPLCIKYGVDIVFGGDNHYYSRAVVDGVQHITTGGGGAPLYSPNSSNPNIVKTGPSNHFCKIDIQGYDLTLVSVTPTGTVYDSFTIQHTPPIPPSIATNPNPQDGVLGVGINSDVSWSAGNGATSHIVYFGTTIPLSLKGNQSDVIYDPGALLPATTYYWRVDEVNSVGTTEGNVWSFTTTEPIPPSIPTNISPLDNSVEVPVNTSIAWNPGEGADSYDIHFGTSSPAAFHGNQTSTTFKPATNLSYNTTYFWSIKSINDFGSGQGSEWSFTTEAAPPHNDQVSVTDGYDQKNGKTLVQDGKLRDVTSSNNTDIEIEKEGYYQTLEFGNVNFPSNVTIISVKVFVEHSEESGYSTGNLSWEVGTGWPGSATVWATASTVPVHTSDRVDSWDLTNLVSTPEMVNDLELKMTNNDRNGKVFVDYAYLQVEWKEGTISVPEKATNPNPMHTEVDVPVNSILSWISGDRTSSHDIYFGTTSPGEFQGSLSGNSFDPGILSPNTTYFWRVDEKNTSGITTGDVWSFVTVAPVQYTLDVNSLGNGSVSVDPLSIGGVYDDGTIITITATPNPGNQFDGWSGAVTGTTNPIIITMDGNKSITANFSTIPPVRYSLTTDIVGNGAVIVNPVSNDGFYAEGTTVKIIATADAGSKFDAWSGAFNSTNDTIEVLMDSDKVLVANFSIIPVTMYTLTTDLAGNGTISLDPFPINGKYEEGTVVTVTATPSLGSQFEGWSGAATGKVNPITITMNGNKLLTAGFSEIQGGLCDGVKEWNPNDGWWTYSIGDKRTNANMLWSCVNPSYAYYEPSSSTGSYGWENIGECGSIVDKYSLSVNVAGNGSVILSPAGGVYNAGTAVAITATADEGNQFSGWSGDATGIANQITIVMDGNKNITGNFKPITVPQYTLTVNLLGDGNGSVSFSPSGGTYDSGTVVTINAVADNGSQFNGWSGDATGNENPITIIMNSNKSISGSFSLISVPEYNLTVSTVGEGDVALDPIGGVYPEGTVVTLTATAGPGSQFSSWSGDLSGSTNPITITMTKNNSVTATFQNGGGICDGVNEWNANDGWWNYSIGDLRTNANQLWRCTNPTYSYIEPSSSSGHYGWEKVSNCN